MTRDGRADELRRLGRVLRAFREQAGLSQEAFADLAGVHRTYVGGIERGERNVTFLTLWKLLDAAEVTWSKFARALQQQA